MGVFTTAARTWASGEKPSSANFNGQLRDLINGFAGWTAYTPAWTSSGTAPALGNGTVVGAYCQVQKLVHYRATLTMGSTTTFGTGNYAIGLPVNAVNFGTVVPVGRVTVFHGGGRYLGHSVLNNVFDQFLFVQNAVGAAVQVTNLAPATFVSGDIIGVSGSYEAA